MSAPLSDLYLDIQKKWAEAAHARFIEDESQNTEFQSFLQKEILKLNPLTVQERLSREFFEWGPLHELIENEALTEILVNAPNSIWYEKGGILYQHHDSFLSESSYANILERISQKSGAHLSLNHPYLEGKFLDFRVTLVDKCLTSKYAALSLRRHPRTAWDFNRLAENKWCTEHQAETLKALIQDKKNFLIIGETGSGKTSIANACLQMLSSSERAVLIEDCSELILPNDCSLKLLTREDPYGQLTHVAQQDLIRRSLRLRPDRLVMGEIRSTEAKDFLMMLSTGHAGSFGTLHAQSPHEALIRLEMLVQLGAPQWNLSAIRRLIFLSLHFILVTERNSRGERRFKGLYKLASLEDSGFTLEPVED